MYLITRTTSLFCHNTTARTIRRLLQHRNNTNISYTRSESYNLSSHYRKEILKEFVVPNLTCRRNLTCDVVLMRQVQGQGGGAGPGQRSGGSGQGTRSTLYYVAALGVLTLGLSYAAVPLYRIFCQVSWCLVLLCVCVCVCYGL